MINWNNLDKLSSYKELEGVDELRALSAMVFGKVNDESREAARLLL